MHFAPFGTVENVRILPHKHCAFVNFEDEKHAREAKKQLNGTQLKNTTIVVNYRKVTALLSMLTFHSLNPNRVHNMHLATATIATMTILSEGMTITLPLVFQIRLKLFLQPCPTKMGSLMSFSTLLPGHCGLEMSATKSPKTTFTRNSSSLGISRAFACFEPRHVLSSTFLLKRAL